jgi:cytosine/uracil/thiamine/allantoin permease
MLVKLAVLLIIWVCCSCIIVFIGADVPPGTPIPEWIYPVSWALGLIPAIAVYFKFREARRKK